MEDTESRMTEREKNDSDSPNATIAEALNVFCEEAGIYSVIVDRVCRYISKFGTKNLLNYFDRNFGWMYDSKYARAPEICAMAYDLAIAEDPLGTILAMQAKNTDMKISSFGSPASSGTDDTEADQEYDAIWDAEEANSLRIHSVNGSGRIVIGKRGQIIHRRGRTPGMGLCQRVTFLEVIDQKITITGLEIRKSKKYGNGRPGYYGILRFHSTDGPCTTIIDNRLLVATVLQSIMQHGGTYNRRGNIVTVAEPIVGAIKEIDRPDVYSDNFDPAADPRDGFLLTQPERGYRNYVFQAEEGENKKFDLLELQRDSALQLELRKSLHCSL
jgi:hypothetical protein